LREESSDERELEAAAELERWSFGKLCVDSIADAAIAVERHSDSLLRTSSLRVGRIFAMDYIGMSASKWAFSRQ
jgi:hypothetical protein